MVDLAQPNLLEAAGTAQAIKWIRSRPRRFPVADAGRRLPAVAPRHRAAVLPSGAGTWWALLAFLVATNLIMLLAQRRDWPPGSSDANNSGSSFVYAWSTLL